MGIETFPEIENFQKLPRQVIVKGGDSSLENNRTAVLSGIVINNSGNPIRNIRVNVVVFDERKMPVLNTSTDCDPPELPQGGIGAFTFRFQDRSRPVSDYYLYANWRFDD